jgi:hypothetical protein
VWNADDDPIVFRIGINLGEVLIGEADIQGHSVNVAARNPEPREHYLEGLRKARLK